MKTRVGKMLVFFMLAGLFSCEEFLDKQADVETITEEEVFTSYYNLRRFADNMYNMLFHVNDVDGKHYTHPIVYSDEGIPSYPRKQYENGMVGNYWYYIDVGSGNGRYEFTLPFEIGFQGIRIANVTVEQINTPADITQKQQDELLGQCYYVRAQCYFQILARYGGMPYFRNSLDLSEYLGFDRLSYYETAVEIAKDCDMAFEKLPHKWDSDNTGRPIKAAALALKSRVLLYAASQTYNKENDLSKWEAAAVAASELIDYIESDASYHRMIDASEAITLDVQSVDGADYYASSPEKLKNYREIFINHVLNEEIIFSSYKEKNDWWDSSIPGRIFFTKDYARGKACMGACPSQNAVDRFETQNGLSWEDDPSYDPQNPYVNRDPRFYNNILYNGVRWPLGATGDTVQLYNTDIDGNPGKDRCIDRSDWPQSLTGYIARKYWPEGISAAQTAGQQDCIVPAVWFRVTEAYLNYAEAAYEASGRSNFDAKYPASSSYTALSALNKVRNRVGMPNVHSNYLNHTDFIERIRNERGVEFMFEDGHRWWDIRRWHIAQDADVRILQMMDLNATDDLAQYPTGFIFNRVTVGPGQIYDVVKQWDERHYFYPLKPEDVAINDEFDQNPGW